MSDNEMELIESNESEQDEMDESGADAVTETSMENGQVYLPGKPLEDGEELVCDQSAYVMYHQAQASAPCLSFDIIKDKFGENRETFPMSAYIVAGTQASKANVNNIVVMKLSNLHRTSKEDESDESDEDENEEEKTPKMCGALIKHQGSVNRIRCAHFNNEVLAATWSELGRVSIWNLNTQLEVVEDPQLLLKYNKQDKGNTTGPLFVFSGHQKEGFAVDWCPTMPGVLATGDCRSDIHVWKPAQAGSWNVDQRPLIGHTGSVEDIQWSPNEQNVMATCSVDKSIRIWDIRAPPSKACMLTADNAHESDVNVINWNKNEPFIVSGGDDGFLHIWDLRKFQDKIPIATFKHHTEPVVSVEWHPTDSAVFASGGADNQIALWDLSVEKDSDGDTEEVEDIPPQLLFIHQGQVNIKELHWHSQLPGVIISTAESGFNIFKTISV